MKEIYILVSTYDEEKKILLASYNKEILEKEIERRWKKYQKREPINRAKYNQACEATKGHCLGIGKWDSLENEQKWHKAVQRNSRFESVAGTYYKNCLHIEKVKLI